jgi:uncharacterized protein YxjI
MSKPDIYTRAPINKTAAMVVSQSGCSEELTDAQRRDSLVARWKYLKGRLPQLPKNCDLRKKIGKEMVAIQNQITELRPRHKVRGLQEYIVDVLKERYTKYQWEQIIEEAERRKKQREGQ